jgi:hypothetical protein
MTRVRVVSLRSFEPVIDDLSPRAFRAWQKALDWCCFHATDGVLTAKHVKTIGASPADAKELLEAGLWQRDEDGRTLVLELCYGPAVIDVEGSDVVEHRKPSSIRQARWREKNKRLPASTQVSTDVDDQTSTQPSTVSTSTASTDGSTPPSSLSDLKSSPNPESSSVLASDLRELKASARVAKPRPKRHLIPDEFPSESELVLLLKYGRNKGLRDSQIREELEALELWAKGSGALKLDWMATAKGWLRRVAAGSAPGFTQHQQRGPLPALTSPPARQVFVPGPEDPEAAKVSLEDQRQFALAAASIGRRIPA